MKKKKLKIFKIFSKNCLYDFFFFLIKFDKKIEIYHNLPKTLKNSPF